MTTVRSPTSEHATKRKHKRPKNYNIMDDIVSLPPVEMQLQTLEKWYRALTIDMSELRSECARVRLEIEKVDDTAEAAVENSERCAEQALAAQERVLVATKVTEKAAESTESKVHAVTVELDRIRQRCVILDKKVAKYNHNSITEDFLMTQLTELQEQYEHELTKVRDDNDAALVAQQKQLERVMGHLKEDETYRKQLAKMTRMMQSMSDANKRLTYKVKQVARLQQADKLERKNKDEQGRTRDLNTFYDKLTEMERRITDAENKLLNVDRRVDNLSSQMIAASSKDALSMPPPSVTRELVRPGELSGIYDELRRINHDLRAVGTDYKSLATQNGYENQIKHHMEQRLQDLSTQLFDALGHDSRVHAMEISRLKDAVFDIQSDHREFVQRLRSLEDDVQQATRVQPRYRPGYNQQQPTILPLPPPVATRNRQERASRYEAAIDNTTPEFGPPIQYHNRWAPRCRSRSRSPSCRTPWEARNNDQMSREPIDARSFNQPGNPSLSLKNHSESSALIHSNVVDRARSPPVFTDNAHGNRENTRKNRVKQFDVPFRRFRQPRRIPEVIVIDEDNDDDDGNKDSGVNSANEEEDDWGGNNADMGEDASRAPPDVVLSEEELVSTTNVIGVETIETCRSNSDHVETTDLLENKADLRMGLLLYFCLGGAPDLNVDWTNCFTQLNADECVDMPRALRFQRRYGLLQSFPMHLTQCILQAVIVNRQNVGERRDSEAPQLTGALNLANLRAEFDNVMQNTHLSWAKALMDYLVKQARSVDGLALEKLELSVNPAGISSLVDEDDVIYSWSRRQESVMWVLAQKLHYGSFVPAMICNVDASPAVYLFILLFDVLSVTSECPQYGTFRLNAFGSKAFASLWNDTLKELPYTFFADWSWLEDQSTKERLPALAFCHLLATLMLWNSAIDRNSLTNRNIYAAAVKHILPKLYVGGRAILELIDVAETTSLALNECESTHIELLDLDSTFASTLGLDGFFEVTEAIQNNMLSVAASELPQTST